MNLSLLLPFALLIGLASCTSAIPADPGSGDSGPTTPDGYKGPPMRVALAGDQLTIEVEVPTGGFVLGLVSTAENDGRTDVKLSLVGPGENEGVTQALEKKTQRVALVGRDGPIHVHLQEKRRGVEYFVEPEFQLAKIVPR